MITQNIIGRRRTLLKNVFKGTPRGEWGIYKNTYRSLRRKGYIAQHGKKKGEPYISLFPSLGPEVIRLLNYNRCDACGEYLYNLNYCEYCRRNL